MNNLELLSNVEELHIREQREINGGFVCGGLCIGAIAFGLGSLVGVAISTVVHHHT